MPTSRLLPMPVVLCALSLAACFDQAGDAGRDALAQPIDVCAIVTRDDAAATLGRPVLEGEPSVANFTQFTCRWKSEDDFGEISVEVRAGDPKRFTEFYEFGGPAEPVEGIGARAEWDDTQGLEVLTSDYFIGVFTVNFSLEDAERRARSVELARKVLGQLPVD